MSTSERLLQLRQRRGELLGVIAAQRLALARSGARWQFPLALADSGLAMFSRVRSHPLLLGVAVALLLVRRRSVTAWFKWGILAWRGYQFLARFKSGLATMVRAIQRS